MPQRTCCFTGHRELSPVKFISVKHRLLSVIDQLISRGITNFCAGGALGFDTLAALTVLEAKNKYPQIKLIMILPCKDQADNWSFVKRENYKAILRKADEVFYVAESYSQFCMQKRNQELVNRSSICVCCLERSSGGTAYTVNYAKKKGLEIINLLNPE